MSKNHFTTSLVLAPAIACFVCVAGWMSTPGRADCCPSHKSGHVGQRPNQQAGPDHSAHQRGKPGRAPASHRGTHGGQVTATKFFNFEVVYRPRETRVYLYTPSHRPVAARGVQGRVVMQVRGNKQPFHYRLKHVAPPADSGQQDCLAVAVDVSRIRDGQMTVTFELTNLPHQQQAQANFTQVFALSKTPLRVAVAALTEADRAGIDRQQVCPVTRGKLGSMGTPVKVLVGDHPVYLCCKGCVGKVKSNPDHYLAKAAQLRAGR